ncbi:hydantoinase B/oxoprolinase family protein [Paradesulfitobacterium aromaticivorans]
MPIPTLEEKLAWMKPAPPTEYELACVEKLSLGSYEIGVQRTNDILDEAMEVFMRSSRSSMGVAGDSIVSLFTANGDLVNAASGTFLHGMIQSIVIKYILKYYSENPGINDGDIWFTNDAVYGGVHNPDVVVVMPTFYHGQMIGWTGAALHTTETGAIEPGGMSVSAKTRFEEGFNVPPLKIGQNFILNNDFIEMAAAFGIRAPQMVVVDLKARSTAADRARTRILELADKKGVEYVVGLFRKMLIVAEQSARERISSWPDGKYRSVNFSDGVGPAEGLVRTSLMIEKKGDRLLFDFSGTSPENFSSYNAHPQAVVGHVSNFVYEYVFHDLPVANSVFDPIDFYFPEGTCLSPDVRAATSCSVMIATGVMSAVHNCFGKMMFCTQDWQQVTASAGNAGNALVVAGLSQWNMPYADMLAYSLNTEGQGGKATGDGVNTFGFPWAVFGRAPDVETMENEFPMLVPFSQHWTDSCGHGKYRGGVGSAQLWVAYHERDVWFLCTADNTRLQTPQPIFGGYAPCTVPGISIRKADLLKRMLAGEFNGRLDLTEILDEQSIEGQWIVEFFARSARPFAHGDVITIAFATGGAGYGDPLEREPELVLQDLQNNIISLWSAENIYKVALDYSGRKIDPMFTGKLRQEEYNQRLERGLKYQDFQAQWSQKMPPQEILHSFGTWPEGKPVQMIMRA